MSPAASSRCSRLWPRASLSSTGQVGGYAGLCLDVAGGNASDGTAADLYTCNGTTAQIWQPQPGGALYNPQSGKCLDDTGASATPGTHLQIWSCTGAANQHWTLPAG